MSKKIIFIGPAGAGKTTLKKVFFEGESSSILLEQELEPTHGKESTLLNFKEEIGIFDLAGQENQIWFSDRGRDVFSESNTIICVLDIRNSLESIIRFLIKIYKLKKELQLHSCKIIAFLHKIDLRSSSYVYNKLKTIQEFITLQHPRGKNFEIYKTSITKDNFYDTFYIISKILNLMFNRKLIPVQHQEFQKLKRELSIILNTENNVRYSISDLVHKLKFNSEEIRLYLEKLEYLGFVEIFNEFQFFKLTDRAYYFKVGLEKDIAIINESQFNKKIELFHIFLCLREKRG